MNQMKKFGLPLLLLSLAILKISSSFAQVDEIRSAGKNSRSENNSISDISTGWYVDMAFYSVQGLIQWQEQKLSERGENPQLVSVDLMVSVAAQPSSYYIINPRIRGNWGIFSTDFRLNYILEESVDGIKYIRTNDWQILELNLITSKNVNFYIGGGIIHESFNESNTLPEYSTALYFRPVRFPVGFNAELRFSEPRFEFSGAIRKSIFERSSMNIYLTLGAVRQRYYSSVTVWGLQFGIIAKMF
jgi:hypothetical protein